MAVESAARHPDSFDVRIERIFYDEYEPLDDRISEMMTVIPHNGRPDIRFSEVGEFEDFPAFNGTVQYDQTYEGYDTILTYVEFAKGFQVERKMRDDDQFGQIEDKPAALARAAHRTRAKHAHEVYNKAFDTTSGFYVNSEGVAMCSNSHTTRSGASTASGFDNLGTAALSATSLETARQAMLGFRDDRGNKITVNPNCISVGIANEETAHEIVHARGKVDTASNNPNFHEGSYKLFVSNYIEDGNDWWLEDTMLRRNNVFWVNRIDTEFAAVEDFDNLYSKFRGYGRWGWCHRNWRHVMGHQVS